MRYLVPTLLFLMACSKSVTPPKTPSPATADDCNAVYENLLTLAIRGSDQQFTADQMPEAKKQLDVIWRLTGKSEWFFTSCQATANNQQTDCMANATSLDGVSNCARLLKSKRNL